LFQTILMAEVPIIMISSSGIDIHTGEFGILLDALKYSNGIVAVVHDGDYINVEEISENFRKLFKSMIIKDYPILDVDLTKGDSLSQLKETIIKQYDLRTEHQWGEENQLRVDVDHIFPVTGVGTVILGRMRSGTITKGETLHVFPSKRNTVLRSIQVNDVNHNTAVTGQRVGLALRGLLPKDVERGFILSNSVSWTITSEIEVKLEVAPYSKLPEEGKMRHLVVGLQAVPVTIISCAPIKEQQKDTYLIKLKLDKEIVLYQKEPAFLVDLNGKPKAIGYCKL
ncbi:MAG: EF-Tu/IF-2/RF-3 family GTPase, partial [Candidatus Heimdallarchaeaceae archaeon]